MKAWTLWHSRKHWERLARTDPLWAVLTAPGKEGGRWDVEEFLRTGEADVAADLAVVRERWPDAPRRRALDFGCGVGRLTQALATEFDEVTGVDISDGMLAVASQLDRRGGRVKYLHNTRSDLRAFPDGTFDLVYSLICLQHIPPPHGAAYVAEFMRVLAPGGVAVFQVPAENLRPVLFSLYPRTLWRRARRFFRRLFPLEPYIPMNPIARESVTAILAGAGARDIHAVRCDFAEFVSYRYFALKA